MRRVASSALLIRVQERSLKAFNDEDARMGRMCQLCLASLLLGGDARRGSVVQETRQAFPGYDQSESGKY